MKYCTKYKKLKKQFKEKFTEAANESASTNTKTILCSYLHAGNDIQSADNIADNIIYDNGKESTDISETENGNTKTLLTAKKLPHFTTNHSFKFKETGIMPGCYFDIRKGVF